MIRVEVVFAATDRQRLVTLEVAVGSRIDDAIQASRLPELFPEYNFAACDVGIWGSKAHRGRELKPGDRVEIYRPLVIEPREARRSLAAQGLSIGNAEEDS